MKRNVTSSRHRAREVALQTLYAIDLATRPRPPALTSAPEQPSDAGLASSEPERAEPVTVGAERVAVRRLGARGAARPTPKRARRAPLVVAREEERVDPASVFERIADNFEAPAGAREFAWILVSETCDHASSLDELIAARASNWRVSRMAAVDRNILRLGAYELAYTDTPAAVVLNEAVELARRYGSDTSPAFVNGILDALAQDVREGKG